jgi:hypothetical protein
LSRYLRIVLAVPGWLLSRRAPGPECIPLPCHLGSTLGRALTELHTSSAAASWPPPLQSGLAAEQVTVPPRI